MCARAAKATLSTLLVAAACHGHGHDHDHENEVISRIELAFTPAGGGAPLVFSFDDPDGDGGISGTSERVALALGAEYSLALRFRNTLAEPPEDLTEEIEAESEEHLVLLLGDLSGPASSSPSALLDQSYADRESDYGPNAVGDDLPVGLLHTVTAARAGSGKLRVMLRHLPPINQQPQKTGELPAELAAGRDLPGSVDVDVSFDLVVE